ncbi:hypothetical protein [Actinomadura sp. KC06]|uniref:hypothetical protein n=1 Tax=Actinomadura sp. KC06 TaxID=2530369 RepID=UPI00140502C1|nr:hypothetical protein [Actinomadura sp. KC06]
MSRDGRLGKLVNAAAAGIRPITLAIDPALLDDVQQTLNLLGRSTRRACQA